MALPDFETLTEEGGPDFESLTEFVPRVKPTPLEQYKIEHMGGPPMGPFGPVIPPEEFIGTPNIFTIPLAAMAGAGKVAEEAIKPAEEMTAEWLQRTGINRAAQAGVPMLNLESYPITAGGPPGMFLRAVRPDVAAEIDRTVGQLMSGFTTPGQAALLPAAGLKPVQAIFGAGAVAGIPESIKEVAQAETAPQMTGALIRGGFNVALAGAIGKSLLGPKPKPILPRTASEVLQGQLEREVPNASEVEATTTLHGDVRPQPERGAGEVSAEVSGAGVLPQAEGVAKEGQVSLTPEEQQHLDLGREGVANPVEVVDQLYDENNAPFAGRRMATVRPDGTIEISPPAFKQWLKAVPEDQRPAAVKAMLAEEANHDVAQKVLTPEEIEGFWNNLSGAEQAMFSRIYTGEWSIEKANQRFGINLTPKLMGFEALNHFQMRFGKMTPREVAEAVGREKWTVQTLDALSQILYRMRRALGTKASGMQQALLDRVIFNVQAAKAVAKAGPGAFRKEREIPEDPSTLIGEVNLMGPDEFYQFTTQLRGMTEGSEDLGMSLTKPEQLQAMYAARQEALRQFRQAVITKDVDGMTAYSGKSQYFGEAIEAATGTGSAGEYLRKTEPDYKPPFPEAAGEFGPGALHKDAATLNKVRTTIDNLEENIKRLIETGVARGKMYPDDERILAENRDRLKLMQQYERELLARLGPDYEQKSFPAALRKEGIERVPPQIGIPMWDRFRTLAGHRRPLAVRPSNEDMAMAVRWFAIQPESNWKLPEGVRDQIHAWFENQRGTPNGRLEIITEEIDDAMYWREQPGYTEDEIKSWNDEIARLQALASKYIRSVNVPPERYAPAAFRKRTRGEAGTPELPLAPLAPGQAREGEAFPQPTPARVNQIADAHFAEAAAAGQIPSFEEFMGKMQGAFGAGVRREAGYYAYMDAMTKHLMAAKGAEVEGLMDKLTLRRDVAKALKPGEAEPSLGRGTIPDAMEMPATQMQLGEIARAFQERQWRTVKAWRQKFGPQQQRRYAAIGAIIDKLMQGAGEKPSKPWSRTEIGPEDVMQVYSVIEPARETEPGSGEYTQPVIESKPGFRTITPAEAQNPLTLGDIITRGAAVEASGKGAPPRTVSRNVVAVREPSGRVAMVSAWRDPRSGPKVTDPGNPSGPGRKVDDSFVRTFQPFAVVNLREPVKGFYKVFDNQAGFDRYWGDIAIEGTPGIRTSSFTGPEAATTEAQAGLKPSVQPPSERVELAPSEKAALIGGREQVISPTARELETPGRPAIPAATPLYRIPRPAPEPAAKLPPSAMPYIEQQAATKAERFPELFTEEGGYEPPSYGKPTGRIVEYGKPEKAGVGAPLRVGIQGTVTGRRTPAAFLKQQQAANDLWLRSKGAIAAAIKRRSVMVEIPQALDGAERSAEHYAAMTGSKIRVSSGEAPMTQPKPLGSYLTDPVGAITQNLAAGRELRALRSEGEQRRGAALAVIATGTTDPATGVWKPNRNFLAELNNLVAAGRNISYQMARDLDPRKRIIGRLYQKAVEELQKTVDYSYAHWNDPKLRETVDAVRNELKQEVDFENANGMHVEERENYTPNLWEGSFWHDNGINFSPRRLLGTQFRQQRTFKNPYEAIANGPYILATLDAADLVQHRVSQGRRSAMRNAWLDELKHTPDPDSTQPIAKDPVPVFREEDVKDPTTGVTAKMMVRTGWKEPSKEYKLVRSSPDSTPVGVRLGYERLIQTLLTPSTFKHAPMGEAALIGASMLKHGVMLIADTFHFARLTEYAAALLGRKTGFKGGWSVLHYRPEDLPEAVAQRYISQQAADWALAPVTIRQRRGSTTMTRHDVATQAISQGLNATKITDAMYKEAVRQIPLVGEPWWKLIGPYNRWLFDRYVPGLVIETAVRHIEEANAKNPNIPIHRLINDVVKDTNIFFGNLGRQGVFKSATWRDFNQVLFLAPMWVEGLIQKEVRFASRLSGLSYATGRQGVPYLGALGKGMMRGLAGFFVLTQMINLATRQKPTWMNEEKDHKLDAWIPVGKSGYWVSPMSIFAETIHDIVRLTESKPTNFDAVTQIIGNKLGPVGKMLAIAYTGMSPTGERYSTSAGRLRGSVGQLFPAPIAFGTPARALAHAVAPSLVSPPRQGALGRQLLASGMGLKVTPGQTPLQEVGRMADHWMKANKLDRETLAFVPTDEASLSKLRAALRNDDVKGATKIYRELNKKRTRDQIRSSMETWARRPITGSIQNEQRFMSSLDDHGLTIHNRAMEQKMAELQMVNQFISSQP